MTADDCGDTVRRQAPGPGDSLRRNDLQVETGRRHSHEWVCALGESQALGTSQHQGSWVQA